MEWSEIILKGLIAIAAIAGAIAALFKWLSKGSAPASENTKISQIHAGRDAHIINNSFNSRAGSRDGK